MASSQESFDFHNKHLGVKVGGGYFTERNGTERSGTAGLKAAASAQRQLAESTW